MLVDRPDREPHQRQEQRQRDRHPRRDQRRSTSSPTSSSAWSSASATSPRKTASRGVLAAILGSSAWVQVPRAVLASPATTKTRDVSHVQCVAGNRLPAGTPGRMFRIDSRTPARTRERSHTCHLARRLVQGRRDDARQQQRQGAVLAERSSTRADPRRARHRRPAGVRRLRRPHRPEAGISVKTVRNLRSDLSGDGLIKAHPLQQTRGRHRRTLERRAAPSHPGRSAEPCPTPDRHYIPTPNFPTSGTSLNKPSSRPHPWRVLLRDLVTTSRLPEGYARDGK